MQVWLPGREGGCSDHNDQSKLEHLHNSSTQRSFQIFSSTFSKLVEWSRSPAGCDSRVELGKADFWRSGVARVIVVGCPECDAGGGVLGYISPNSGWLVIITTSYNHNHLMIGKYLPCKFLGSDVAFWNSKSSEASDEEWSPADSVENVLSIEKSTDICSVIIQTNAQSEQLYLSWTKARKRDCNSSGDPSGSSDPSERKTFNARINDLYLTQFYEKIPAKGCWGEKEGLNFISISITCQGREPLRRKRRRYERDSMSSLLLWVWPRWELTDMYLSKYIYRIKNQIFEKI